MIDIIGVLEDGGPPSPSVPLNSRRQILVTKGANTMLRLRIVGRSGVVPDLSLDPASAAVLTVRKHSGDTVALASVAGAKVPSRSACSFDFALTPAIFKPLEPGRFVYDVWLTLNGVRDPVVPMSSLLLEPTVAAVP